MYAKWQINSYFLCLVLDRIEFNNNMFSVVVSEDLFCLKIVPEFKTREICEEAVSKEPFCLKFVPDAFKT